MLTIGPPPGAAHSLGTNRRYGPFDARTTEVEDAQLDARMHMKFPGFEGNLFDADEVEKYFHVRGIVVQPGQDYVTAEVDVTHFRHHHQEEEEKQQQQDGAAAEGKEEENNDDAKKKGKRVINLDVLLLLSGRPLPAARDILRPFIRQTMY